MKTLIALLLTVLPAMSYAGTASNVSNYMKSPTYAMLLDSLCNEFTYHLKSKLASSKWTPEQLANLADPERRINTYCGITPSGRVLQALDDRIEAAWTRVHEPVLEDRLTPEEYSEYRQVKKYITEGNARVDGK